MTSIRQVYTLVNKLDTPGVEGYHVDSKYIDPLKIKYERQLSKSKQKATNRPNVPHKTTFIDDLQKQQKKLPGPCTYEPKDLSPSSRTQGIVNIPRRKTIFDEMEHDSKKKNIPAAGIYDKVEVEKDRARMKSDIDRAERANFCDGSMRYSIENPGVGQYNSYHNQDKRAAKWVEEKNKSKASKSLKLPPVGTYQPLPVSYRLFDNERVSKKHKSYFSKEERWKKDKDRTVPFYNIGSEWGMKNKMVKKDILARVSSPTSHRSVYR